MRFFNFTDNIYIGKVTMSDGSVTPFKQLTSKQKRKKEKQNYTYHSLPLVFFYFLCFVFRRFFFCMECSLCRLRVYLTSHSKNKQCTNQALPLVLHTHHHFNSIIPFISKVIIVGSLVFLHKLTLFHEFNTFLMKEIFLATLI